MEQKLYEICDRFIKNRDVFKEAFPWDGTILYPVCAMMYVDKDRTADKNSLLESKRSLKENTGVFSNFRAYTKLPMITSMSLSDSPKEAIKKATTLYEKLKQHFWGSDYLVLGAMVISEMTDEHDALIMEANRIYRAMKKLHPFLTSIEDVVYCLLLAVSDKNEAEIIKETEKCYELLKGSFFSGNSVQALSHAITLLEGAAEEKCSKTLKLFQDLKAHGYKYGTNFELATLGLLANLGVDNKSLIEKFIEVDTYLKMQKGYGFFGVTQTMKYMHISMILIKYFGTNHDNTHTPSALNAVISIAISQQIAFMALVAASAASSSAASNST